MNLNEITIEVTQQCPNRCIYCSSLSDMEKSGALVFDTICKVVDEARELGAKSVSLSGGEPFFREDIVEIIVNGHGLIMCVINVIHSFINEINKPILF